MGYRDLRAFLDAASAIGEVKTIEGADWDLEIGCITELSAEKHGPILLFDAIAGYPRGYRIATNFLASPRRFALAMGVPLDLPPLEILRAWKEKSARVKLLPPRVVATGEITENVLDGDAADLERFPAPRWHQRDGGRYIGTADMVINKDPDTGWVNVGTYRACIHGPRRLSLWMNPDRDGRYIAQKYWSQGRACPVAVVLGADPTSWMASPVKLSRGVSELDYMGALHGEPLEVLHSELTGLPIPAHAEIVVEGEIPPVEEESVLEGPFGEWPGYYTHIGHECVVRVKRIMFRNDPILLGNPPLLPITQRYGVPIHVVRVWEHLENAGIANIRGVWTHINNLLVVISLKQAFAGHATHALITAAGLHYGPGMDTYYVAVDDDIDPSNLDEVLWAMCTRVDPAKQVQILSSYTTGLDPRLSPERKKQGDLTMGRMLIDACRPWTWRNDFALPNRFDDETRARVWKKWAATLEAGEGAAIG
jgi:UbiD family decarboxylase